MRKPWYLERLQRPHSYLRWITQPVIVTIRDRLITYNQVLLSSYYTTLVGGGGPLKSYPVALVYVRAELLLLPA